ncbi:MAG: ABC transporter ATP-binding protein [Anaerolineales bacterium]|nr:ABC transporter ATP-binding protein [Anaerolineales bacterium]
MKDKSIPGNPFIELKDLSVAYISEGVKSPVLRNINLEIKQSQIYGLVGESGSGKTTLGLTLMRYLPSGGQVTDGIVKFGSLDLFSLSAAEVREMWGRDLSLVPQDPYSSLNPSLKIGDQITEIFRGHQNLSRKDVYDKTVSWLKRVQLPDPEIMMEKYPHELSGGQKQRVLIAMALVNQPKLLVLDEPTTSLDVTTEAVVLDLLRDLIREEGTSVLYISHNLGIVAGLSDRVAVLYAGELVEDGPTDSIYSQPLHPYTRGLIDSIPRLGSHKDRDQLTGIPGQIPSSLDIPHGCVFAPRCHLKIDLCTQERPALEKINSDHSIRCHRWREIQAGEISHQINRSLPVIELPPTSETVLDVQNLVVSYGVRRQKTNPFDGSRKKFHAVDGVNLQVQRRHTLGIVGESGSGKSSLALAVMGLAEMVEGDINLLNIRLPAGLRNRDKELLPRLQMVFQNLDDAFSPYLTVEEILKRPLMNLLGLTKKQAKIRAAELLKLVKLPFDYINRYPYQLSGGEKQRIAIAQAFAANPDLLIADEPVSALDVSVQANILNLLNKLQREQESANILISHDIAVVSYLADEIAVMYLGQIMQFSEVQYIFQPPFHPYTEALLSAVPGIDPEFREKAIRLKGDVGSPIDKPGGCPFHTRCPRYLGDICKLEKPAWQKTQDGKHIYCHIPVEELALDQEPIVNLLPEVVN